MTSLPSRSETLSIILIGAGGHARVVAASARRCGLELAAVLETNPGQVGRAFGNLIITAETGAEEGLLHVAIGSNAARRAIVEARPGARWTAVIDPAAVLGQGVVIGHGALIGMGACLQTGVRIGRHAIVNTGAIIDHDTVIGDFAHIAPGVVLTGGIKIGNGALIGAGAVVLPGLSIGDGATVGAGAVVTRSVGDGQTVVGSPARLVTGEPT